MLFAVIRIGRAGEMDKIQVDVVDIQVLQRLLKPVPYSMMPMVIELGGDPDLVAGDL
jgi:hypothetical protein